MTTDVALGVDIGTSGVRIAAVDETNALKAMSAAAIMAPIQMGGRILQDPAIWWEACAAAFKGLDLQGLNVRAIAAFSFPRRRADQTTGRRCTSGRYGRYSCAWALRPGP